MLHLSFGHSFAELVALILLPGLAFYFLNKKKASVLANAEDARPSAPSSLTAPTETISSGCSSSLTGNCYEVFLSFRGSDTRKGFTDHLYHGLLDAGIDTFRDDDELCQGHDIRPVLMEAITNSKVLIPIFSESYGTSSWCLDELVQIMERRNNNGQIVLPIFYKVEPSDVGHQRGRFGEAFREREDRLLERGFARTALENWKKALLQVSTLSGCKADGYEADLVRSIVRKVLSELKKKFELDVSESLVGIDRHVKEILEFVNTKKSHATLFVGIHGMGGIGKTTLAKAIYNKLSNEFEYRSFIADIRESWKRNGVHSLQNQLIYDISKRENEVHNEDKGAKYISSKFNGKKVLLLLDDVDDVVQLKRLAGNRDWFSSGSMIIITTRNERILKEFGVDYAYDHKEMDSDQSMILFSKHALRRDSPPRGFENLAHKVVSITGGLPLSLEVLGSLLCGQKLAFWRGTIDKLKKMPPKEVREKLRVSYEVLEYEQKQIFLDIACFFVGTDGRTASYMWDACHFFPGEGIEVLRFLSLIKFGDDHELRMHDQLRDLGREIVREENRREPQNRSRLWEFEEVKKVLKENKGTGKIEAIDLTEGTSEGSGETAEQDGDIYTEEQFKNLTSLRFLHVKGAHLRGDFNDSMEGLRWLRWRECPMNFEVNNFPVKELAVLELPVSEIKEKWEGWSSFMMAEQLQFLDLTNCASLENTDFLSAFKNLEVLILNDCWELLQIDSSIGDVKGLRRLELSNCWSLTKLPEEIGKLKELEQLLLPYTQHLSALPESIGSLQNLEILNIAGSGIEELPNDIGRLRNLRELHAKRCKKLRGKLPESIGSLQNLEILDISETGTKELPNCIGRLRKLRDLNASYCKNLKGEMPESIGSLENLEILDISGTGVKELPNSMGRLRKLRDLKASDCKNLKGIMSESMCDLSSLQRLNFFGCKVLQSLPDLPSSLTYLGVTCQGRKLPSFSHLTHLKELEVENCKFLECIQVLPPTLLKNSECSQLTGFEESELPQSLSTPFKLEILKVRECKSIGILDVSQFIHLRKLSVDYCVKLREVRGLDKLKYLECLTVDSCDSVERLDLPKFGGLKIVNVEYCKNLVEIQGLENLEFLEILNISRCSMQRLLLPQSGSLKKLDARECTKLDEIRGLDRLEFLGELNISCCTSIKKLHLPKSEGLMKLIPDGCKMLAEIRGLDMLEFLEVLDISRCASIERLDLPKSGSMKELHARGCVNLAEIRGLEGLEFLKKLDISGCIAIERLDLPKSGSMKELHAKGCVNLAKIRGLEGLEFLKKLDISACTAIERLDLPNSESMKELYARGCVNLAEIQGLDRLEFLEELNISKCASIEPLNLPKSDSLKKLNAGYCESLVEIQGLGRLEFLEKLDLSGCSIERLDLQKSKMLEILDTNNCANLVEIQGLNIMKCLTMLNVSGCTSFERLPNLCCFDYLKSLTINGCDKLQDIQSLERFPSCKSLRIEGCKSLAKLPNLSSFHDLRELFLSNCHELRDIPGLEESISLESIAISGCSSIEILPDLSSCTCLMSLIVQDCEKLTELRGLEKLEELVDLDISGSKSLKTISKLSGTRLYQNYEMKISARGRSIEFGLDSIPTESDAFKIRAMNHIF